MLFSKPCPVDDETREWIEQSFSWMLETFGTDIVIRGPVVEPTAAYFPNPYNGERDDVEDLVCRVCEFMRVDPSRITLNTFVNTDAAVRDEPLLQADVMRDGPVGLYMDEDGNPVIALEEAQLADPLSVVATAAHELGHVRLLGDKVISPDTEDHEPLTDLITVFHGLGIFTANTAFRFEQHQDEVWQGWSTSRSGYLSEEQFGFALALYAWLRSEHRPQWAQHLSTSVKEYFKRSERHLRKNPPRYLQPLKP
ncbi:hypothetical protein ABI59_21065 [Acidobacteria bacterium Mor1]|nr:hypothetical protein ABI59_21065 [Acidobacteria bacterium Mor1]